MIWGFSNRSRRGKIWSVMRAFSHVKDGKILTRCVCLPCCIMNSKCREHRASLVAQSVKKPPAMQETCILSLGWEDPLEEGMATHSSILAWGIPMDRREGRVAVHGVTKSQTWLSTKPSTENIWQWSGFSGDSARKNLPATAGDMGSILGSGRSPGERNGNPLQYFCLENPMDRAAGGLQSMELQRVRHDLAIKQ